jgi:hypothetical protein
MDLIDKDLIEECIKSGERLKKQLKIYSGVYGHDEHLLKEIIEWWQKTANKLHEIETIYFDDSFVFIRNDPITTIECLIENLKNIETNSLQYNLANIAPKVSEKDSLLLIYSGGYIYDADEPKTTLRLNRGFRKDLMKLCFCENPAHPCRKISLKSLEDLGYTLKDLKKKDGLLENLYEQWAKKFNVSKKIIKNLIILRNTEKGYYIEISENIAPEF